MKKSHITLALLTAAVSVLGFAACSDDTPASKDLGKTPVVKYVRVCDPEKADSLIVQASLGSQLVFVGENLGDVQQMYFNDVKAKLNPTMVTSNTIIVEVPDEIASEVTDIVKLITSTGLECDYPFHVSVPAPRVEAMTCEYAPGGSQTKITGAYFVDDPNVPLTVIFPGGKEANIVNFTQTEITITVPEDAPEGPVTVSTIYGKAESSFYYKDTRGMMFDFDGLTGLTNHGWHNAPVVDNEYSISGNYICLNQKGTGVLPGWDDSNFAFEYWPGDWNTPTSYPEREGVRLFDVVDFTDWENMSLKFEMAIPASNPWSANAMQLIFTSTEQVTLGNAGVDVFGNTVPGSNNDYVQSTIVPRGIYCPWTTEEAFSTDDQWITVVVPLKNFTFNYDGGNSSGFLTKESFAGFTLFVVAGGRDGSECSPIFRIDNIRAVKN